MSRFLARLIAGGLLTLAPACSLGPGLPPAPALDQGASGVSPDYRLGPLDQVQIFVWRSPELSVTVPVRPDGRISTPLIQDLDVAGKTPSQVAQEVQQRLRPYINDPVVTVIVSNFSGPFDQQIRVVGEATRPTAIPYRANMTMLDVMIAVGGLTDFAAGNRAVLVRTSQGPQQAFNVRLNDLLRDGDIRANVAMLPGDVVIVPQSWF